MQNAYQKQLCFLYVCYELGEVVTRQREFFCSLADLHEKKSILATLDKDFVI